MFVKYSAENLIHVIKASCTTTCPSLVFFRFVGIVNMEFNSKVMLTGKIRIAVLSHLEDDRLGTKNDIFLFKIRIQYN